MNGWMGGVIVGKKRDKRHGTVEENIESEKNEDGARKKNHVLVIRYK